MPDNATAVAEPIAPEQPARTLARKKAVSPVTGTSEVVVRLMCVDDHALLVQGMRVQAELDPEIDFVSGLPDVSRLVDEVARIQPDVVTLDVEMSRPPTACGSASPTSGSHSSAPTCATACSRPPTAAGRLGTSPRATTCGTSSTG
jgi:hypothetical protein